MGAQSSEDGGGQTEWPGSEDAVHPSLSAWVTGRAQRPPWARRALSGSSSSFPQRSSKCHPPSAQPAAGRSLWEPQVGGPRGGRVLPPATPRAAQRPVSRPLIEHCPETACSGSSVPRQRRQHRPAQAGPPPLAPSEARPPPSRALREPTQASAASPSASLGLAQVFALPFLHSRTPWLCCLQGERTLTVSPRLANTH